MPPSGKTIKKVTKGTSESGHERVVLTISDDDRKKGTQSKDARAQSKDGENTNPGSAYPGKGTEASGHGDGDSKRNSGKEKELTEQCVITDGTPQFKAQHIVLLTVLLLPLLVVLTMLSCRCLGSRRPHGEQGHSPGAGDFGPQRGICATGLAEGLSGTGERRPQTVFVVFLVAFQILTKVNITVILTTAHLMVTKELSTGGGHVTDSQSVLGGATSGLLIAVGPIGGCIAVVVIGCCRLLRWPRETCMGACTLVSLACVGFVVGLRMESFVMMMLCRLVSGCGEGAAFLGQCYLARLSSPSVRTELFGLVELGTAAGLVGGPLLASVTSTWFESAETGETALLATAALACSLFLFVRNCLPSNEALGCHNFTPDDQPCWKMDIAWPEETWSAVLTTLSCSTTRLLCRLVWESCAVMVLTAHFCLGYNYSGYGASLVICAYVIVQLVFVRCCTHMSDHNMVRVCELMELCGLIMIFRLPRDLHRTLQDDVMHRASALGNIMVFLMGSALFYTGNCLTAAPVNSWGTKACPHEVGLLFYNNVAINISIATGAFLSRLFAGTDPHQNMLVLILLPAVLIQMLILEMSIGRRCDRHGHHSLPTVRSIASPEASTDGQRA